MKHFFGVFCLFFALFALFFSTFSPVFLGKTEETAVKPAQNEVCEPSLDVLRFLVLGTDQAAGLTDSIFLVTLNKTEKNARILQIPRDTYANYTPKDYKKINGALHALGEQGLKQRLAEALGVPIHYFVVLDLSCMRRMVDAIGGVELCIPQDLEYSDPAQGLGIHLLAGTHHLDGAMAEHFVRYRAGYVNADLGRLDAQKLFLQAFAQKCRSLTVAQLLRVTSVALTMLQTDLSLPEAMQAALLLRACDADSIPMATLCGQAAQGSSGAWYYVVNREGACRSVNEYLLPAQRLELCEFDRNGFFDRPDFEAFHKIYLAPEGTLPVG